MHLGHSPEKQPIARGFEEFYGLLSGCSSFFNPAKPDPDFYNGGLVRPFAHNENPVTEFPDDYYATDAFTDHAIKTIKRFAQRQETDNRPFFVNLNYTAPHFPLHALPEDIERYRGKYADGYEPLRQKRYDRLVEIGLLDPEVTTLSKVDPKTGDFRYDYEVVPWEKLDPEIRAREEARMEVYAAMVDPDGPGNRSGSRCARCSWRRREYDRAVPLRQRRLRQLAKNRNGGGILRIQQGYPCWRSTGYEFVGKSWGWAQNSPFRKHKVWPHEGGIRTPLIVRWPGKSESQLHHAPTRSRRRLHAYFS